MRILITGGCGFIGSNFIHHLIDKEEPYYIVNLEDYFSATQKGIKNRTIPSQPLYLCISYDTDLLAFESIIPYCQEWINFVQQQPELLVEIRTKSAAYHAIRTLQSSERVILAWTISPDQISRHYELGAPPFQQRLDAIKLAIEDGWPIRLCFDPVLAVPSWRSIYGKMFEETFKQALENLPQLINNKLDNTKEKTIATFFQKSRKSLFWQKKKALRGGCTEHRACENHKKYRCLIKNSQNRLQQNRKSLFGRKKRKPLRERCTEHRACKIHKQSLKNKNH